jgi:hypothetical protein
MPDEYLQRRADVLAARVDALAEALRDGGVADEASAQLLSRASAAVLQALNLEALRASGDPQPAQPLPPQASYCLVFDTPDERSRTFRAAA